MLDQVKVTPCDQQVLNLLVQGCSNKEIAGPLHFSSRTVKQRLRTMLLRAGIREGRKRVKLAIAMFTKEEAQSRHPASASLRRKFRSRFWSGKVFPTAKLARSLAPANSD